MSRAGEYTERDGNNLSPFFGEIYGRMPVENYYHNEDFNSFKNQLLIPFWGTALAVKVLYASVNKDVEMWRNCGLSISFAQKVNETDEMFYLFGTRLIVALVPGVGTVINGALDIIAQLGIWYKQSGNSALTRETEELTEKIKDHECADPLEPTPVFGEVYGRMSEDFHGTEDSHLSCRFIGSSEIKEYEAFNWYKNQLLIPFWGTILAVRTLYAVKTQDRDALEACGISRDLKTHLTRDFEPAYLFGIRCVIAIVPGVGTLINGAVDIVAQLGIYLAQKQVAAFQEAQKTKR
jgi:hypothetical protein